MPFNSDKTDHMILAPPTEKELLRAVRTIAKQKPPRTGKQENQLSVLKRTVEAQKLLKEFRTLPLEIRRAKVVKFLGDDLPDVTEKSLGKLFLLCKQRGQIKQRYHSYCLEPFLFEDKTPNECLNIFRPFELLSFSQPGEVDVRNSAVWRWLWVAWANKETYKMEWLLSYFAHKLQYPSRKVCKFITAFCRQCGCGKTSIRHFISAIFSSSKTLYYDRVEDYMSGENSEQKGRLFIIIDDIENCSRKLSLALKSKISNPSFTYKELYKNKVTLPNYSDIITTSNHREPKFIDSDNRRDELVVINPALQNNTEENSLFWKTYYAELDNPELMGKWFHFLAHYKITHNVTSQTCRFDLKTLQKHKLKSMKVVHRFVVSFFEDPACFERDCLYQKDVDHWFKKLCFYMYEGVKCCFITKQRLYDYFTGWKKRTGLKLDCKMTTMVEDLKEIGIKTSRREFEGHKPTGFCFRQTKIRQAIKSFYKVDSINLPWNWCDDTEFAVYKKNSFRFRGSQF